MQNITLPSSHQVKEAFEMSWALKAWLPVQTHLLQVKQLYWDKDSKRAWNEIFVKHQSLAMLQSMCKDLYMS